MDYCVIIVTHDPAVASLADIQVHMVDGRILEQPAEEENAGEKPEKQAESAENKEETKENA